MTLIQDIQAREILDARGLPALEAEVTLNCGALGRASIPQGVPRQLLDQDQRYLGQGLRKAMEQITERICLVLRGLDALDQKGLDRELLNLSRLSGNATLAVSLAVAQAAAIALEIPLSRYLGGVNATRLPQPLVQCPHPTYQPKAFACPYLLPLNETWNFPQALQAIAETTARFTNPQDAPEVTDDLTCLDALRNAIEQAGYSSEQDLAIALETAQGAEAENQLDQLEDLTREAPVPLILAPQGMQGQLFQNLRQDQALTIALREPAPQAGATPTARILSLYDFTTLTDFLDAAEKASTQATCIILDAQRPGTEDAFSSELAIAIRARQYMAGPLTRFDAVARYNQLLRLA